MKRTGLILIVVYTIGLCGCATATVQSSAVSGNGNTVEQKQTVEGNRTAVNVNVNINLPFRNWSRWGDDGLTVSPQGNTATFNGMVNSAGYNTTFLDTELKNKTIGLAVRNASDSVFDDMRMVKITVNRNDRLVKPLNVPTLIYGEYVPSDCDWIEFVLPPDFDGKLGFTFYQARLNELKITAYHN